MEFPEYQLSGWELRLDKQFQKLRLQYMNDCIHRAISTGEPVETFLERSPMIQHDDSMTLADCLNEANRVAALRKKLRNV